MERIKLPFSSIFGIFFFLDAVTASIPCPAKGKESDVVDGDSAWVMVSAGLVLLMTPGLGKPSLMRNFFLIITSYKTYDFECLHLYLLLCCHFVPKIGFFYGGLVRRKNMVNTLMMSWVAVSF